MVARDTKSYQILCSVLTEVAPRSDVVDFEIFHSPTMLATPAVPLKDSTVKFAISLRLKPQSGSFESDPGQGAT